MLRVILADDEQYERNYLEKVIKESYPGLLEIVCKAVDGMDLLEKLEECKPQIVLLDIKMPRMDGLKTAEEVRKRYPDIQIVLISAYSDFSFAKQAIKLGVTDYLLKPYLDSELRETLDKVIARVREREDTLSMLSYSNYLAEDGKAAFAVFPPLVMSEYMPQMVSCLSPSSVRMVMVSPMPFSSSLLFRAERASSSSFAGAKPSV